MQGELRALLLSDPSLSALVQRRVFWDEIEQGAASPNVVLYLVTDNTDYHMGGPSGLVESRVQIDCRGITKQEAKATADAVQAALSGFAGTQGGVKFGGIFKDSGRTRREKTEAETFFVSSADYIVWSGNAA